MTYRAQLSIVSRCEALSDSALYFDVLGASDASNVNVTGSAAPADVIIAFNSSAFTAKPAAPLDS